MPGGNAQLQRQQQQKITFREQAELKLNDSQSYIEKNSYNELSFADKTYEVYFESREQEEQTRQLLESSDALERYYEEKDPAMLTELKNKSFFNFPGKKSERKRLRKLHLEKLEQKGRLDSMAKEYRKAAGLPDDMGDEEVLQKKSQADNAEVEEYYRLYEGGQYGDQLDTIKEKVRQMDPVRQDHYTKLIRRRREQKVEERKQSKDFKVFEMCVDKAQAPEAAEELKQRYLNHCTREELDDFRDQVYRNEKLQDYLRGDLQGKDSKELQNFQTALVQLHAPAQDYHAYRLKRLIEDDMKARVIPEEVKQKLLKKYSEGDLVRTCLNFMKPVHYRMEGEKKVPDTAEDQKNLEYNIRWSESLLSDKEEDWNFRFEEMTRGIERIHEKYKDEIDKCDGTFSDELLRERVITNRTEGGILLCISGISELKEQNALFHSKYYENLPVSKQKELQAKYDVVSFYFNMIGNATTTVGVSPENGKYSKNKADMVQTHNMSILSMLDQKKNELKDVMGTPYQFSKEGTRIQEYHGDEAEKSVGRLFQNQSITDRIEAGYTGEANQKLRDAVKKTIHSGRVYGSEEDIKELEKKHADDPEMLAGIAQIRRNRELVSQGKLGEDVLRVLSNDRLMLKDTSREGKLYHALENYNRFQYKTKDAEKSKKLQGEIREEMKKTLKFYPEEDSLVQTQDKGIPIRSEADLEKEHRSEGFVHFKPKEQQVTTARWYISAAEGMTVEAIRAFNKTLEGNPEFQGKFYIKYSGQAHGERDDTIVLYSDGTKDETLKRLLDEFQKNCGEGVLKKDTNLPAARHVRDGISIAPGTSVMENMMKGFRDLRGENQVSDPYQKNTLQGESTDSYNRYISKLLLMSRGVAEERYLKNHPDQEAAPGLKDDEMKGLFNQVYQEFLTASGIDPATMLEQGTKLPGWVG